MIYRYSFESTDDIYNLTCKRSCLSVARIKNLICSVILACRVVYVFIALKHIYWFT